MPSEEVLLDALLWNCCDCWLLLTTSASLKKEAPPVELPSEALWEVDSGEFSEEGEEEAVALAEGEGDEDASEEGEVGWEGDEDSDEEEEGFASVSTTGPGGVEAERGGVKPEVGCWDAAV